MVTMRAAMPRPWFGTLAHLAFTLGFSLLSGGCRRSESARVHRRHRPVSTARAQHETAARRPQPRTRSAVREVDTGHSDGHPSALHRLHRRARVRPRHEAFHAAAADTRLSRAERQWRDDTEDRPRQSPPVVGTDRRSELKSVLGSRCGPARSRKAPSSPSRSWSGVWEVRDPRTQPKLPDAKRIARLKRKHRLPQGQLDSGWFARAVAEGFQLEAAGIAKGYIVDRAADVLKTRRALVDSWCRPAAICTAPAGNPTARIGSAAFRIHADRPVTFSRCSSSRTMPSAPPGTTRGVSSSTVGAITTSSIHAPGIRPPRRAASRSGRTTFTADAVDDAVFILGAEKGLSLVESLDGVGAVIVDSESRVHVSPAAQRQSADIEATDTRSLNPTSSISFRVDETSARRRALGSARCCTWLHPDQRSSPATRWDLINC